MQDQQVPLHDRHPLVGDLPQPLFDVGGGAAADVAHVPVPVVAAPVVAEGAALQTAIGEQNTLRQLVRAVEMTDEDFNRAQEVAHGEQTLRHSRHAQQKEPKGQKAVARLKQEDMKDSRTVNSSRANKTVLQAVVNVMRRELQKDAYQTSGQTLLDALVATERYIQTGRLRKADEKSESEAYREVLAKLALCQAAYPEDGDAAPLLQKYTRELSHYFSNQANGNLSRVLEPGAVCLTASVVTGTTRLQESEDVRDRKDEPLFPHEPCAQDVQQGCVGDCYLLAALASTVATKPSAVRDIMRDNGDGTVTVRFYYHRINAATQYQEKLNPIYVTVKKEFSMQKDSTKGLYSRDSLWVHMIERAYAASGLHPLQQAMDDLKSGKVDTMSATQILQAAEDRFEWYRKWQTANERVPRNDVEIAELLRDKSAKEIRAGGMDVGNIDIDSINKGKPEQFMVMLLGTQAGKSVTTVNDGKQVLRVTSDSLLEAGLLAVRDKHSGDDATVQQFYGMISDEFKRHLTAGHQSLARLSKEALATHLDEFLKNKKTLTWRQRRAVRKELLDSLQTEYKKQVKAKEESVFAVIATQLADGKFVTASSLEFNQNRSGLNEEPLVDGIVGKHAYSVIGTAEIDGRKFIKVRNPWGEYVRHYYTRSGSEKLRSRKGSTADKGVFLVEIGDFVKNMSHFSTVTMGGARP